MKVPRAKRISLLMVESGQSTAGWSVRQLLGYTILDTTGIATEMAHEPSIFYCDLKSRLSEKTPTNIACE
jgi:hypothetical protein